MKPTCPGPEQWRDLLAGRLPDERAEALAQHLGDCAACRQAAEGLARADADPRPPRRGALDGGLRRLLAALRTMPPPPHPSLPPRVGEGGVGDGAEVVLRLLDPPTGPGCLGRLGRYEVQRVLGCGGFGVVLRAFDPELHRPVAVKVLAPHLAASAAARERFTREARAGAALHDEHVVAIHDVGSFRPDWPYFVMEYVQGQSLQDKLERSAPLPLVEALRIAHQTALGLAAAHAQGLVHRDVKPANILLENGVERVKLTDFGLVQAADDALRLTQTGTVAGTPEYMAPEQARGEAVDARADLFSLGTVLYELCTGRSPFRAATPLATLRRVSEETPPPVRSLNPAVPDWLEGVIARLHAKAPADRFRSAAEAAELFGRRLQLLQQGDGTDAAAPDRREPNRESRAAPPSCRENRRFRTLAVLAFVLLLTALLGGVVLVCLPGTRPPDRVGVALTPPVTNPPTPTPTNPPAPPAPQAVVVEDLLSGKWSDPAAGAIYEFRSGGRFSAKVTGQATDITRDVSLLDLNYKANQLKGIEQPLAGAYTYTGNELRMTYDTAPPFVSPTVGRLTWAAKPDEMLFDQDGPTGRRFVWTRVP